MDTTEEPSVAHAHDWQARWFHADGLVPWLPAEEPDYLTGGRRTISHLRSCGFCGSMHPADLVVAIKCGARVHWADMKYGWPHKLYVDGVPNPFVGMMESRAGKSHPTEEEIASGEYVQHWDGSFDRSTGERHLRWIHKGEPAPPTTSGKFYTLHLLDASDEECAVIEAATGLHFEFHGDGGVRWSPFQPTEAA